LNLTAVDFRTWGLILHQIIWQIAHFSRDSIMKANCTGFLLVTFQKLVSSSTRFDLAPSRSEILEHFREFLRDMFFDNKYECCCNYRLLGPGGNRDPNIDRSRTPIILIPARSG
jgi:hypothetical protein